MSHSEVSVSMMVDLLLVLHDNESSSGTTVDWCRARGISHRIVLGEHLSDQKDALEFRGMIIFGGDMEAWQTVRHRWLKNEKEFLRHAILEGKGVFGLCLGAQLLAEQLGAEIQPMHEWELGWYPVEIHTSVSTLTPLHWHSTQFTLPPGATAIAKSAMCAQQGFRLTEKLVGFQFHGEIDQRRLEHAIAGWKPSYRGKVQSPDEIRAMATRCMEPLRDWYFGELDAWWASVRQT